MAKFSIKDAVGYGCRTYMQNIVLMLCVGVTIGLASWGMNGVPRLVADQLGVTVKAHPAGAKKSGVHPTMPQGMRPEKAPQKHHSKMKKIHHELKETGKKIHGVIAEKAYAHLDNNPTHLVLLFLIWVAMLLLYAFVHMGLFRVSLDLVDKNTSSYERLFSQRALILPYIGLMIVYTFLVVVIAMGAIVAGFVLGGLLGFALSFLLGETGGVIGSTVGLVTGLVVFCKFAMRYIFAFYCLVDKKMGIHKSLTCTYEITKGSVGKLILLMIVLGLPFMLMGKFNFHVAIGKHVFNDSVHPSIIVQAIAGLITPLYTLCLVHVYRKLGRG
ncbi:MAG: hypothetical protein ACJAZS_000749 [Alteromonas naphthalenivorans]|jgi:hypothetical protein